jgi:HSP20 family protein
MPLIRFDPFREFDRMLDQAANQARQPSFPMDAYRSGDTIVVHFDLPGVDPSSIDLEYERQTLTVSAQRTWQPTEGDQLLAAERVHGRFQRQILLGEGLDADGLKANYEHGVLTVTIPVAEKAKPRKISVELGAADQKSIRAGSEPVSSTAN